MPWPPLLSEHYEAAYASAVLDKCIIELQHYLRHIKLHGDHQTAQEFRTKIFKLEADCRRICSETKNDVD